MASSGIPSIQSGTEEGFSPSSSLSSANHHLTIASDSSVSALPKQQIIVLSDLALGRGVRWCSPVKSNIS